MGGMQEGDLVCSARDVSPGRCPGVSRHPTFPVDDAFEDAVDGG